MISGDAHVLAYDTGELNSYGSFPIFQCAAINSRPSCKNSGWTDGPFLKRGQYCHFEVHQQSNSQSCLKFKGYQMSEMMTEWDTCSDNFYTANEKWDENWQGFVDLIYEDKLAS